MPLIGLFSQNFDPNFRTWVCDENVRYIQREISRRLSEKYVQNITMEYDTIRNMLIQTMGRWMGPLTLDDLLEMVICDFVNDINTDIEWNARFNHFEPRTLYFPGTDLTREEKVKLNPGYKLVFQMNY